MFRLNNAYRDKNQQISNTDLPESCCLCQAYSVQQPKARAMYVSNNISHNPQCSPSHHPNSPPQCCLVTCLHCNKRQCLACSSDLHLILMKKVGQKDTGSQVKSNSWLCRMTKLLEDPSSFDGSFIEFGTCCQFTQSIPSPTPSVSVYFSKTYAPVSTGLINIFTNNNDSDSNSNQNTCPRR